MFVILVFIYILLFVYFTGFGLSRLILPKKLAEAELILIPFIGIAFSITVLQNLNYFLPVNRAFLILLFVSLLLAALSFIKNRSLTLSFKEDWRLSLVFLFSSFTALYPIIRLGYPTTRSMTNNDGFWFTVTAKWFQQNTLNTIPEITHLAPLFSSANLQLNSKMRIGIDLFLAAISSAFNLDPYQVFSVLIAFLFAVIPLAVYLMVSVFFKLPKGAGLLAALVVAANNGALRLAFEGNLAQLAGLCFLLLSIGTLFYALVNPEYKSKILAALMIVGLESTYLEMIPFLVLPLLLFLIYGAVKRQLTITSIFSTMRFVTVLIIVLNLDAFNRMAAFLKTASSMRGDLDPWMLTPTQSLLNIFGLVHLRNGLEFKQFLPFAQYFLLFLAFISILLCFYGLIKKNYTYNVRFLLLAAIVSYLGIVYRMRYIQEFGYGFYKALIAGQFVFLIVLAIGIYYFWQRSRNKFNRGILLLFLLPFIVVNLYNEGDLVSLNLKSQLVVDNKYISLGEIKEVIPTGSIIFLANTDSNYSPIHYEHYAVYFLDQFAKMKPSFYSHPADYFVAEGWHGTDREYPDYFFQPDYSYVLTPGKTDVVANKNKPVWSNGYFYLYERRNVQLIVPGKGWSHLETIDGNATRWTENEAELFVDSNISKKTELIFTALVPPNNEKTLYLYLNDELVQTFDITDKLEKQVSKKFQISKGRSELKFRVSADIQNVNDEDPRQLGVALQNIELF